MTSSYKRGKFVEDGGWAMIVPANCSAEPASPVSSSDHREAAGLCAEELAKREIPASGNAAQINDEATTAQ